MAFGKFDLKTIRSLHKQAIQISEDFKQKEVELIEILQKVDAHFVYRALGYQSLYKYCTDALKLSEHQSYNLITVARKSVQFPALKQAIINRELTVSKARKVSSMLNEENQSLWLTKAKQLNSKQLEQEIAKENPRSLVPERARFLTDSVLELQMSIGEKIYKKLQRVQGGLF